MLPLVLDLANPSPAIGWTLKERSSALERMSGNTVIALALVHHLAISNHVPLAQIAALFGRLGVKHRLAALFDLQDITFYI